MRYPPELRRQALDLLAVGEPVKKVAVDLGLKERTIYQWRRRYLPHLRRGRSIPHAGAELNAARRRITELETELAVLRRATDLLCDAVSPKGDSRQYM
ncbi:helix-turn-helix domain-containing protein [Streptomyces sp. NPDC002896]|uniref:helix-turn-helix domain-containing protein n=1 Tax=Streptomyces sp. NPDC002896 TaxID=3154438 RepID=UPI003323D425